LGKSLILEVAGWAAVVSGETTEQLGLAEAATAIPAAQRRRLPAFSRDVLRCTLPLLRDRPGCPVVLSSPHGDLISTVALLTDIARREILSPSLFALSVHNAPTGALSLCLEQPGDQTSLAGDAATLSAGLTECYARLATGEVDTILLVHAEEKLPTIYADLDDDAPGVFVAMVLRLANNQEQAEHSVGPSRAGAVALTHALAAGQTRLRYSPPQIEALAA
jgi:hypothetical protein